MILSICNMPEVLKVLRLINIILLIIRIVVPILLIISVMIELIKAVTNAELNKLSKPLVNKIIAAVLVFLIPTFVKVVAMIAGNDGEYEQCLKDISTDTINQAYTNIEEDLVKKAEESKDINDYYSAYNNINSVKDNTKKIEFEDRLSGVKNQIDEANKPKTQTSTTTSIDPKDANISNIKSDIIFLGDSRTNAYKNIKSFLEFNGEKETVYAKDGAGYGSGFKDHMLYAASLLKNNPSKTYAITVNYGVNDKGNYKKYCDYYDDFIKGIDKKNSFYIVSVNPIWESKVRYNENSNRNVNVVKFNDYMKNTCINQIKTNSPDAKVYYCDVYGSMSVSDWINKNYIAVGDGIHYTHNGSKYIYEYTKKCIASNE